MRSEVAAEQRMATALAKIAMGLRGTRVVHSRCLIESLFFTLSVFLLHQQVSVSLESGTVVEQLGKEEGISYPLCSCAALETEISPRAEPVSLNSAGLS